MFTAKSPMTLDRQTMHAFYNALARGAVIAPMYGLPVHGPAPAIPTTDDETVRSYARSNTCAAQAARFLTMAALAGVEVG